MRTLVPGNIKNKEVKLKLRKGQECFDWKFFLSYISIFFSWKEAKLVHEKLYDEYNYHECKYTWNSAG